MNVVQSGRPLEQIEITQIQAHRFHVSGKKKKKAYALKLILFHRVDGNISKKRVKYNILFFYPVSSQNDGTGFKLSVSAKTVISKFSIFIQFFIIKNCFNMSLVKKTVKNQTCKISV